MRSSTPMVDRRVLRVVHDGGPPLPEPVPLLLCVGLVAMPSLAYAALAPALFIAIATIEGHFITPSLVGRRLTLSPFVVFLALAFWTWLWGPIGAFLAVPLVIVSFVVLGHLLPQDIGSVIDKLRHWAVQDVIAIDWDEPGASTAYQFGHPYRELYGDALKSVTPYGRQSIFLVRGA